MIPKRREKMQYEKVKIGEFVNGEIDKIEYDESHVFKHQGEVKEPVAAVRFVFKFEGYVYPKRSRWMQFTTSEKSNLYQKYVSKLVVDPAPDMLFNFDELIGMKIKTIWSESGDYQNLESIFPLNERVFVQIL